MPNFPQRGHFRNFTGTSVFNGVRHHTQRSMCRTLSGCGTYNGGLRQFAGTFSRTTSLIIAAPTLESEAVVNLEEVQ